MGTRGSATRRWWKRIAAIVVLPVVAVVALDVMTTLVGPALDSAVDASPLWRSPQRFWQGRAAEGAGNAQPIRRQLNLHVSDGTLYASYDLWLPLTDPVYQATEAGQRVDDTDEFVEDLLGTVSVGEFPLGFHDRVTTLLTFHAPTAIRVDESTGHLHLDADPYNTMLPEIDVRVASAQALNADTDRVVIERGDQSVFVPAPANSVTYQGSTATIDRTEAESADLVVAKWRHLHDSNVVSSLRRVGGAGVPVVGGGLWRLFSAVPSILALLWLRRGRPWFGPLGDRLVRCAAVCAGVALASAVLAVLLDVEVAVGPFFQSHLAAWASHGRWQPDDGGVAESMAVLTVVLLLPLAVACGTRSDGSRRRAGVDQRIHHAPRSRDWLAYTSFGLFGLAQLATVALFLMMAHSSSSLGPVEAALGWAALSVVVMGCVRVLAGVLGAGRPWCLAAGVVAVLDATVAGHRLLDSVDYSNVNLDRVAVFTAAAAVAVGTYAVFVARALTAVAARRGARSRLSVSVVAALVVVPTVPYIVALIPGGDRQHDVGVLELVNFLDWLTDLNWFVLTGLVLVGLRQLACFSAEVGESIVPLGAAVLAALTFYWDDRWAYIPVTVLAGAALTGVLLRPGGPVIDPGLSSRLVERAALVTKERDALRRRRLALISALDTSPHTELETVEKSRRHVEARISALPADEQPVGDQVLDDRWRHGKLAAWIGAAVGLPWTVIYLSQVRSESPESSAFGTLYYLSELAWTVGEWGLFGFFFGYFFPLLRGRTGVTKSISLAAIIVAPPLIFDFIESEPADWRSYGVWVLQVFAFAIVLGFVAGDRVIMARTGLSWRYVVDLYNARFTAVWASALVLALGGIVAAGISSGLEVLATSLIGQLHMTPPTPGGH
ncbi:hypothetical protein GCM10023322_70900 [Rugosimonospora acidiphila]|uniref:Uncharacterized protein n=1 Tax=Rugosimonospora acidiphila TaxID=556531 RepID=A0ABP9SLU9_9ACTN